MLTAVLSLSILAALFGLLLGYADLKFKVESDPVVEQIDAVLPQTQCGQCGFPGCRSYAEAIANDDAPINLCPPGGEPGMIALADLLGRAPEALDEDAANRAPSVARIDETLCVGCTACIRACPVDAIIGAAKQMHSVIAHYCTGCRLCVEPCPVDCIAVDPVTPGIADWKWPMPAQLAVAS